MKNIIKKFYQRKNFFYGVIIVLFLILFLKEFFFPINIIPKKKKSKKVIEEINQQKKTSEGKTNLVINFSNNNFLIYPLDPKTVSNEQNFIRDSYHFTQDKVDLEKMTQEKFISFSQVSNQTYQLINDFQKKIFIQDKLFEYEDDIYKKFFEFKKQTK